MWSLGSSCQDGPDEYLDYTPWIPFFSLLRRICWGAHYIDLWTWCISHTLLKPKSFIKIVKCIFFIMQVSVSVSIHCALRKQAYSNILTILWPKIENFQIKNSDIFHISAQNIDCGYSLEPPRRGGSNECPQSMFWAEIRQIMYTPVNPSFTT